MIKQETGSPGFGLPSTPEIFTISFKKVKGSMGLSIVAAIVSQYIFFVLNCSFCFFLSFVFIVKELSYSNQ